MTPAQFWALAQIARTSEPTRSAARMVLVDGIAPSVAAEAAEISRQSCSNAVGRLRRAHALLADAYAGAGATIAART
jgi:hypothetical protein